MPDSATERAAAMLRGAYSEGPIDPVRELLPPGDAAAAYAVQEINTRFWEASGRRVVGRKIGLTSRIVQQQLGVDQPDFGVLFADMEVPSGDRIEIRRLLQPRAEAEIAFILGRDLIAEDVTCAEVLRATEFVLPAIEIVDSRIADWRITLVDTIADNASSGLYVLGTEPRTLTGLDLRTCGMVIAKNGEVVSYGAGSACLGHPLNAVKWLAATMSRRGWPLRAGDVVLSGALGAMVTVQAGDAVWAEIGGLGHVESCFV